MVFQLQTRNRLWEFRKILKRGPFSNEIWIEYGSFKVSNSGIWQVVVFLMQKIGRTGYIEEKSKYLVRVRPTMCENWQFCGGSNVGNWICKPAGKWRYVACWGILQFSNRNAKNNNFARKYVKMGFLAPFLGMTSAWRNWQGSGMAGWCGDGCMGWLGRMMRWPYWIRGEMVVNISVDITADTRAEIASSKQFYRTAYCTGVVIVSGHSMQWESDMRPWYGAIPLTISETMIRTAKGFWYRREPSDGRSQIRRQTKRQDVGMITMRPVDY